MENERNETALFCHFCGCELTTETICEFDGVQMCRDCLYDRTTVCDCCGDRIWNEDDYGDENICLCESCRDENYTRCNNCDTLISNDDVYYDDDDMFWGHCILVYGTLENGIEEAQIAG